MSVYEVIPYVSRTTMQPHPHAPGHYLESTHVDMWAIKDTLSGEVMFKHWHKESCDEVRRWIESGSKGSHPCMDVKE